MNKVDLARFVAKDCNLTIEQATQAIDSMINNIRAAVVDRGEKVNLKGFGRFEARHRKARLSINPQNPGEKINVPASDGMVWNPSPDLRKFKIYK